MIEPQEYTEIVNARWRLWYAGAWRPVTTMFAPGAAQNNRTNDPRRAVSAVVFMGSDDPNGDWLMHGDIQPGDIYSREPSHAIPGLDWHRGARLREAIHGAPQAREKAFAAAPFRVS